MVSCERPRARIVRRRLGLALQLVGLVLMPLAFVQGFRDVWGFGEEIVGTLNCDDVAALPC